eukprot:1161098-Pelagomonas_calceolata.AAC.4
MQAIFGEKTSGYKLILHLLVGTEEQHPRNEITQLMLRMIQQSLLPAAAPFPVAASGALGPPVHAVPAERALLLPPAQKQNVWKGAAKCAGAWARHIRVTRTCQDFRPPCYDGITPLRQQGHITLGAYSPSINCRQVCSQEQACKHLALRAHGPSMLAGIHVALRANMYANIWPSGHMALPSLQAYI